MLVEKEIKSMTFYPNSIPNATRKLLKFSNYNYFLYLG